MYGVGVAITGAMLAYVLGGGRWAMAGAVIGAVTGSFAPSVYDASGKRDAAREGLRGTFERIPPQSWARLLDPRRELVGFLGRTVPSPGNSPLVTPGNTGQASHRR